MSRRADGTRAGATYTYNCAHCGKPCTTHKRTATYCGSRCTNLARYDRIGRTGPTPKPPSTRIYITDCTWCGRTNVTRQRRSRCAEHQHCKAGARSTVCHQTCAVCAGHFVSRYANATCSAACAHIKRARRRRAEKDKRRALEANAYIEHVDRQTVYARDGWRCHLCNRKVLKNETSPHPLSPSLDHVIPLASGGTHEPQNCRTAHLICNARKSNRGSGEQLLLIA